MSDHMDHQTPSNTLWKPTGAARSSKVAVRARGPVKRKHEEEDNDTLAAAISKKPRQAVREEGMPAVTSKPHRSAPTELSTRTSTPSSLGYDALPEELKIQILREVLVPEITTLISTP